METLRLSKTNSNKVRHDGTNLQYLEGGLNTSKYEDCCVLVFRSNSLAKKEKSMQVLLLKE